MNFLKRLTTILVSLLLFFAGALFWQQWYVLGGFVTFLALSGIFICLQIREHNEK